MVDSGGWVVGIVASMFSQFRSVGSKIVGFVSEDVID